MTLFIFKYALPALLGYTLFVGIAGKFNPLRKPAHLEERPSWMLGLWTGASVFLVLSIGLHMAYGMTLEAARSMATPSAISMALLLGLGFIGYSRYQKKVAAEIEVTDPYVEYSDQEEVDWSEKAHQLDSIIKSKASSLPIHPDSSAVTLLQTELEKEKELRQETERHLRITRKALSTMHKMTPGSAEEHAPLIPRQNDFELVVANLKRELVKARQEIRLHISARAKALSTANRSVAFARQSIELRARLETELETAHSALANRQTTITSLISRLERERRLTDDELASLSNHLAINDQTFRSRYSNLVTTSLDQHQNAPFTNGS
ncbi:MAG: hypothetical protein ACI8VW_001203 [bacterium]|jgi:hypothetical protein